MLKFVSRLSVKKKILPNKIKIRFSCVFFNTEFKNLIEANLVYFDNFIAEIVLT